MKQEYQSAYRKLNADPAFRDRLIRTLEEHQEPRRTRPRWMVPVGIGRLPDSPLWPGRAHLKARFTAH